MFVLVSNIQIGDYEFDYVSKLKITQGSSSLTSTATIELPRNLKYKQTPLKQLIKQGDLVRIKVGYNGSLSEVFVGYITKINADTPIKIECEDMMFLLKKTQVNPLSLPAGSTLQQLLAISIPKSLKVIVSNQKLGKIALGETTAYAVLKMLFKHYNVRSYFINDILYIGDRINGFLQPYSMQGNVISNKLEYKQAEDIRVKVKAVSIDKENNKTVVEVGDADGALRTIHFMNLDKASLTEQANQHLKLFKFSGYRGSFTAFGQPETMAGDVVQLEDNLSPEHNGSYECERVDLSFGTGGYRRTIHLGKRVA